MIRSDFENDKIIIEYDDTTNAWYEWKHEKLVSQIFHHERFSLSFQECTKIHSTYRDFHRIDASIPELVTQPPVIDVHCYVCRKAYGYLYPCRICGKVYHQQCLRNFRAIKDSQSIKNAMQPIGWTCPICEDLRIFLTTEELAETNNWIKSLNIQKIINLDYYINMRLKTDLFRNFDGYPNQMKSILQNFLTTLADTSSARLTEDNLILLDICLKIVCLPPQTLLHSLTQFELYRLSQLFLFLSSTDHQHITYKKFHQIFQTYFPTAKDSHLETFAYNFLGQLVLSDQTWSQFLLDMIIPTILSRLNHRLPSDFPTQIIFIGRRSTNSSPTKNSPRQNKTDTSTFIN